MLYQLFIFTSLLLARLIEPGPAFRVMAFYTAKNDAAHISFVKEAKKWFAENGEKNGFSFTATNNWDSLNTEVLATVEVVVFLDTRPEEENQRKAFQLFMEKGGAWMGFHFSAFALTPSAYPQNWNWYHVHFLGSGEYVSNTWRPTSAVLRLQSKHHPATKGLPETFRSSPNEWYRWKIDLRKNPNIKILAAIDPSSFPLGTGPKPHEIWNEGFFPVVWTNTRYHMVYFNMGHNDIDYENKTNKELSHSFGNEYQDKMVLQSLLWLGRSVKKRSPN